VTITDHAVRGPRGGVQFVELVAGRQMLRSLEDEIKRLRAEVGQQRAEVERLLAEVERLSGTWRPEHGMDCPG